MIHWTFQKPFTVFYDFILHTFPYKHFSYKSVWPSPILKSPLGILCILSQVYRKVYTYLHEYFSVCFASTDLRQCVGHKIINLAAGSPTGISCSPRPKAPRFFRSVFPRQFSSLPLPIVFPSPLFTEQVFSKLCLSHRLVKRVEVSKVPQKHFQIVSLLTWRKVIKLELVMKHLLLCHLGFISTHHIFLPFIFIYIVEGMAGEYFFCHYGLGFFNYY